MDQPALALTKLVPQPTADEFWDHPDIEIRDVLEIRGLYQPVGAVAHRIRQRIHVAAIRRV
ncbi:hypothetical protein [Mycolicibacterium porcinum]|uniref:hypothetical protein n=1 Tax=Mycolicibacterium porcinum TaxID=39693 RepID=UPI0008493348|nr:hypothetical protein [Mycolicibacterium porcinum]ODR23062.1 hypothetical protein BHQ19_18380 [Mycolicibacterium porcinum]